MDEPRPEITRYMAAHDEPASQSEKEREEMWLKVCDHLAKSIALGLVREDPEDDDIELTRDDTPHRR